MKLTKSQIDLLIDTQTLNDWSPDYFPEAVAKHAEGANITPAELQDLLSKLKKLHPSWVLDLQIALTTLEIVFP